MVKTHLKLDLSQKLRNQQALLKAKKALNKNKLSTVKLQKFGNKLMHDRERLMKFSLGNFSMQELCWSVQNNDKNKSREISDFVGKKELSPDESYRARYFGRKSIIVNEYANNA